MSEMFSMCRVGCAWASQFKPAGPKSGLVILRVFVPLCVFVSTRFYSGGTNLADKDVDQCSSPVKKLLRFFKKSRDGWKAKHHEWKEKAKRLSNQRRAVEKSRQHWQERASTAERRVAELERQVEELKFCGGATILG